MVLEETGFSIFITGFFTSVCVFLVGNAILWAKINALEARTTSLVNTRSAISSQEKRAQSEEEFEIAIGEFIQAMQQPDANFTEVLKATAMRHPAVALRLAKKYGISM